MRDTHSDNINKFDCTIPFFSFISREFVHVERIIIFQSARIALDRYKIKWIFQKLWKDCNTVTVRLDLSTRKHRYEFHSCYKYSFLLVECESCFTLASAQSHRFQCEMFFVFHLFLISWFSSLIIQCCGCDTQTHLHVPNRY